MTIYLAGAMQGLTCEEMNKWREQADYYFSQAGGANRYKTINPVDFYNFTINQNFTDKECMLFDLTAVRKSDVILANLNKDSIGTAIELYESFSKGIPVIGFDAHNNLHPWVKECCFKICNSLEDAITYIKEYYGDIY